MQACSQAKTDKPKPDLIFAHISEPGLGIPTGTAMINRALSSLPPSVSSCFGSVTFPSVPPGRDDRDHFVAAASLFYALFPLLSPTHRAFRIMEADVAPVKDLWLDSIVATMEELDCDGLWSSGSQPMGQTILYDAPERLDFHINGNGAYVLGCEGFLDYLCRVQSFYYPEGVGAGDKEPAYDMALFRFRFQPANYGYARKVAHRFRNDLTVWNNGEDPYDPSDIISRSPRTVAVHSKSVFWTPGEVALRLAARKTLVILGHMNAAHRESDPGFHLLFSRLYARLSLGSYDHDDVAKDLCRYYKGRTDVTARGSQCKAVLSKAKGWVGRMAGMVYVYEVGARGETVGCDGGVMRDAGFAIRPEIYTDDLRFKGFWSTLGSGGTKLEKGHREKMAREIRGEKDFQRVDAIKCGWPARDCAVLVPLGKPLIVHVVFSRFDLGRTGGEAVEWREKLKDIAGGERNVVAVGSLYDREVMRRIVGFDPLVIQPWCGEYDNYYETEDDGKRGRTCIQPTYNPTRTTALLIGMGSPPSELKGIAKVGDPGPYNDFLPSVISSYTALIYVPQEITGVDFVRAYRLNVPVFVPSLSMLKAMAWKRPEMAERLGYVVRGDWGVPPPDLSRESGKEKWEEQFDFWIPLLDCYNWPGVKTFESWSELKDMVEGAVDLWDLSDDLKKANEHVRGELVGLWKDVRRKIEAT